MPRVLIESINVLVFHYLTRVFHLRICMHVQTLVTCACWAILDGEGARVQHQKSPVSREMSFIHKSVTGCYLHAAASFFLTIFPLQQEAPATDSDGKMVSIQDLQRS